MLYSAISATCQLESQLSAEERKAMIPLQYGQLMPNWVVIPGRHAAGGCCWNGRTSLKMRKLIIGRPTSSVGLGVAVLLMPQAFPGSSLYRRAKTGARVLHGSSMVVLLLFDWQAFTAIAIVSKLLSA